MSNLLNQAEQIRESRLKDKITEIHDLLTIEQPEDIASIPENVFVAIFLPWFAGQSTDPRIDVNTWLNISGSPYKSVKVIDSSGDVSYVIPPLFDRTIIQTSDDKKTNASLIHVLATYEQLNKISPKRAEAYYLAELEKRQIFNDQTTALRKKVEFWNELFKKHNLPVFDVKSSTISNASTDKIDLEYDDDIL